MQRSCGLGPCRAHMPAGAGLKLCSARHLSHPGCLHHCRGLSGTSSRWRSSRGRSRLTVNSESKLSLYTRLTGNDEDEARDDFKEESRKYRRTVSLGTACSLNLLSMPEYCKDVVSEPNKLKPYQGHAQLASNRNMWMKVTLVAMQVFTFSRWASHRSTSRYYRHILGLFTYVAVSSC